MTDRELLEEAVNLAAIGDIDESTEAHGWGDWMRRARAALSQRAEPVALEHLCGVLPAETYWGDPITPDVVRHILSVGPPYAAPPAVQAEPVAWIKGARLCMSIEKSEAMIADGWLPLCYCSCFDMPSGDEPLSQKIDDAIDAYLAKVGAK